MIVDRRATRRAHVLAAAGFVALAVLQTWPLARQLGTHIPGRESGDNLAFLWNFWWFRTPGVWAHPFDCAALFAPFGTSLVLDTHTALPAFVGATLLRPFSVVTACNLVILAGLALNGWTSYLLAFRYTARVWPSLIAGIIVATSAYVSIHLLGHFNLIHVWTIAVFAIAWTRLIERPGTWRAVAVAAAFAATAYTDYYYAVYEIGLAIILWISARWTFDWRLRARSGRSRVAGAALAIAAGLDVVLIAAILVSGGLHVTIGARAVSIGHVRHPLTALWVIAAIAAVWRWRLLPSASGRPGAASVRALAVPIALVAAASLAFAAPMVISAVTLIRAGGYATEAPRWLSGLAGVDVATLLIGNPLHAITGGFTRRVYAAIDAGLMEQSAWLGLVAMTTLVLTVRAKGARWLSQPWTYVAAIFFVWALGPFLVVGGLNTSLVLPQAFLRYLPILSNARVPGRAFAVVDLAVAMLVARALADSTLTRAMLIAIAALAIAESVTAPYPLVQVPPAGPVEAALRAAPPGIVLELPAGLADGSSIVYGRTDRRSLAWQMAHGHPLVGGFVARLPPPIVANYKRDAWLWHVIQLSEPGGDHSARDALRVDATAHLWQLGVRYVVINLDSAPPAVVDFVRATLTLRRITAEGPRELDELQN